MATDVSGDLNLIQDEDVLRKMWSQADDYDRKKEIRLRMYKLREQRLKSYYTGDAITAITDTPPARKHAAVTHAESITDQGFMTMKDKEIRDSESPTRDLQQRQGNEKYWTTVQDTTTSSTGDDKNFTKTYSRTSDAKAAVDDNTQVQVSAKEQSLHSAATEVTDNATTKKEQLKLQAALSSASETVGPNGERISSKSEQEESNFTSHSTTESKSATGYSKSWQSSSSSSSSSRRVYSSSSTTQDNAIQNRRTSTDRKAITSVDDVLDNVSSTRKSYNVDETDFKNTEIRNSDYKTKRDFSTVEKSSTDEVKQVSTTKDSVRKSSDYDNSNLTYFRSNRDVPYTDNTDDADYEINVKITTNSSVKNQRNVPEKTSTKVTERVFDDNVRNESNKEDSYFTKEYSTRTSSKTVSQSNDVNTYETNKATSPTENVSRKGIIKHPSSLDLPKESADSQYMTTYQQSYQRINVENSPTHNAFASSLRASPDRSPVSSPTRSKSVTDRSSPERKLRSSPTRGSPERKFKTTPTRTPTSPERKFRTSPTTNSPDKDRRISVGSYTVETPRSPVRKVSDITPSRTSVTSTSTVTTSKQKRKFSSTKSKESSKKKASTPSVSPSASPTRQLTDAPDSAVESDNDSDASQATYSKSPVNFKQAFETTTTTTTAASTRSTSEQTRKSSLKKTSVSGESPRPIDKTPQSPERTSPSRTPVVEELIKPKTAYSECGLDCETKIDENIISKNVVTETSTAVNEPTVKPEKTFTAGETCEIEFTIRKNSASKGPEPITQSPIFNNVRDKSPEYSSEGSVGKEVKRMRSPVKESPSSNRSSPERSAFAPIKQFRTSPEIKKTTEPSYPAEKLRKTSNTAPITDAPVGRKPSLKRSSPTKVSSPTRSVSSSASPASSPERRSPQNKIRKPSASAPVSEETEVIESTQETRITRKTSVPRSNSKQSLTKKQPELKTPVKDRVTQGTRIPSSTDLRSSSVTRKTNRASETITITKKAPSKPTEVTRTPQRGPSNSNLKTVKTTLTTTVNASPRYSSPVRKPGTPTQIARLKPSPVRGTGPSNTTTNRVTSRSEVTVTVSPSRKPVPKKETPSMKPRSHEAPKRPESPLRKPTTFSKDAKTSSLRALQLICSQEINKTENVDNFEYEVDIDENNLEDELPPDDFASDVTDRENVRTTTRSVVTKTVTTKVTPAKKPSVQALKSDNKYNRSSNEKLISRLATPKKQPTKPEIVTPKTSRVPTKVSPGKTPVTKKAPLTKKGSTGSTTGTKKTITKKSSKDSIKRVDDDSSSCSEDELHDVSITVDSSERDQKYVEELEEIRRRDESEHGSKVFATSNKDSSLLSVIVQLPSSSRESSPDYASRSQYSAAVSDDGSEKPVRYADRVSEPEDSDVNMKVKSADFLRAEGRIYEQVTDLDEESESETTKVDVSVADRVSKFLQSTKTSNTTTTSTTEVQSKKDKSVLKAAALFDKIVEDQYVPVGPSNKVIDIYSKQFPGHEAVTVEDRSDQYQEILESVLDIDGRRRSSVNVDETDDIAPTRTLDRRQSSVASINKEDYKASIKAFEKRRSSVNVNDVAAATKLSEKRRSSVKPEDVTPVSKTYESRKSSVKPEDVAPVSKTYDSRRSSANVENVVSSTSVYDRRRSSNTEDVILESKTLERRKSSIPAETKSDDVVTEEIINVEVKENKKAPFERKESAFAADYKSRKDFFEKKATTPINSVPSSPRAAPKFGTNLKTTTNQTVETREVTSFTRRDSETRKSPEKDLSTPRKPSLKDSPVENQRLPSSRKSPEKEVPSKVASPKEDAPSPRKDSLPQKDSFTTRRDSFSPKEPASPQKGPLSRKPSEKEVTPTVTETTPTKAPADKPHESTLFKPTLSSSRRSSTPRKSPERQAPIERQPSSNELPQNVRKAPEKPTVRGAKSIMDRLSIFERGATEKTSPVKKTDFRGFGRTTKTESSSTFIQNERKVAEVEKKTDEPEPSTFERKTSRTEIVLKPATPADQKPQTRRDSSVRKSPERRPSASQPSPVEQQPRGRPESPKKSPSVSEFERKSSFTSSTAQKTVQAETSNKFSTTLRRTPSQSGPTPSTPSTAATPKRNSIVKESGTEIEEIFDVQLLEQMMESSKNYDDRRRIRAQIRIAKRKPDTTSKSSSTYETTTVTTTKTTKPTSRSSITEKVEFVTSTPKESPKNEAKSQFTSEYKTEFTSKSSTTTSGTRPVESEPSRTKEAAPTVESKKEIVLERRPSGTDRSLQKTDSFHRRGSKTADGVYEFTVTTKQSSQKSSSFATSKTEEVTGTDSITSSYGVGPTDENGLPLFGLKALRRSNTSKTLLLTDEVSAELNGTSEPDSGFRDTGGRPLFGGLKALKKSAPAEDMPEQPASPQLRDLVQRHEKHVRESTTIDNSPRQKPTRKLRDSFVLQPQDEEELVRSIANAGSEQKHSTEEATSSQKTVSLRSIMKKPDNFDSGAEVHMETRRSVISSHGTVNADGTVSVTRNVVQGKISSKNGEEPSGLITRTQYNYEAPSIHEEGRSETTTQTTTLGNRRLSTGPQITEAIEDSEESRRSSKRYVSSRSSSGTKITEILENGTDSRRSSTHEEADGKLNGILKKSGSGKFNVASSTVVTTSTSETVTNGDSSRKSSVDAERRKPSLVRGDSIKALQHKFQQATVSSSLKQNSGASVRNRSSSNSLDSSTRTTTKTSQPVESSQNETSVKTSSYSVKSKTESTSSGPTSFLDNKSKVTGVQDILERMRNADLASDVTESTEDQEARSLLNKFLGASVILQGMEAGMKSINGRSPQSLTTNSATLVNRVEKQRMASEAKTQNLDELDLETIWDEQHLKNLLEACTDYEGRRKIRARLRTVMAEHKACGDVTALVSNSVGADASMTQGECAFMRSHSRESSTIDDSGTESGEDLRHLSPQLLAEVQGALSRLEGALPGLDPNRRESLVQLVSRLQTCLKIQQPNPAPPHPPPRRFSNKRTSRHSRHTVGVSREELDDARKWLEENYPDLKSKQVTKDDIDVRDRQKSTGSLPFNSEASQSKHYRPVKFNAHHTKKKSDPDILNRSKKKIVKAEFHQPKLHQVSYTDKEAPQSASISFVDDDTKTESTESLLDYDPNLRLFNSSHSKLVNRTLSKPENGSDGDISSAEEDLVKPLNSAQNDFLSSHQKFANFLASENKKQNRFQGRSSKKMKLRRSNTIDIPKPIHYLSSGDDHEAGSADEVSRMRNGARGKSNNTSNRSSIAFEPKTENDRKFLAFLKLADQSEAESKLVVYNSSARGGPHWSSRFSNMKTKFETLERDSKSQSSGTAVPMPNQNKRSVLDKVKQLNAVDSLPVKPIQPTQQISTNQFSHAPRSPFRPICKSPQNPWVKPSASGTVKQMVKEKFCHEATGPPMYLPPPKTTPTHDIVMPQPIRKNIMPTTSNVQKPFSYSSNSVCQQNAFPNYPQGTPMENNFNAATRNQSIQNMYPPDTKFCTNTLFNPSAIPLTPEINPPPPFRNNSNEQFYNSKVLTQYRLPSEANPHLFKTPVQAPYIKPQSPTPFNSHVPQYIPQKDAALNNPSEIPLHPSPYLPPSVNPYPTSISPVNYRPNNTIKHNFPTPDYSPVNYSPFSNSPYNSSSANGSGPLNEKFFPPTDSRSVTLASPYLNQNGQYSVSDPNFHNSQNSSFMMNHSVPFASVNPSPASISGFSTPLNSISNSVTPNFNNTPIENTPLAASNTPNIPFLNNRNSVNIPFTDGLTVSEKAPLNHVSERKNMFTRNFDNFLSDNEEVKAKLSQSSNPHRNSVHNFSNFYEQKPYEPVPIQKTYSLSNIHTKQDLNPSFERNFDPFYSELQPASMSSYPPSSIASNVSSPRFDIIPSSRNYPAETKSYFTPEPLSDNRNSIYASGAHSYSTSNKANGESLPYSSPHLEPTTPIRCLDQPDYESTNTNPKLANISPFQFDDASSSPSSWKEAEPETSPSVMQPQTAVSKVMGKAQCQQAVVVSDRTRHRFDEMAQKLSAELSQKMQSPSDRSKSPSGASVSSGHQSRSSSLHSNFMSPVKSPSSSKSLPYGQNMSSSLNRSSSSYSMTSATTSPSSHSSSSPFHSLHQAKSSSNLKSESDSQRPSPPQSPTIIKATPANKPPGPPLSPSFQQIPPISNSPFLAQFGMGAVKSKSQHLLSPAPSPFCQSQNFSSTRSSPANPAFTSYSPDLMTPMAKFPSSHFSSPSRSPARSPTSSVLQKSESWHQMVVEQMLSAKQAPPLPKISRAKSSHALAYPKQYEASMSPDAASKKQATVKEYLRKSSKSSSACAVKANFKKATSEKNSSATTLKKEAAVVKLNDDLGNVDEAFESLFQESKKKQSK